MNFVAARLDSEVCGGSRFVCAPYDPYAQPRCRRVSGTLPNQPCFGSVWWVPNEFQRLRDWMPARRQNPHPVACSLDQPPARTRLAPTVEGIPRTTDAAQSDLDQRTALETPAGEPSRLDARGWFLVRYRLPVLREGYRGFVDEVFAGDLSESYKSQLREKLLLCSVLGLK